MFTKTKRRQYQPINAGSMADIAFLLLIFFLVTTTILVDTGIPIRLPDWSVQPPAAVPDRNVLIVKLNAFDELFVENERASVAHLRRRTVDFITNPGHQPGRPASPRRAVISLSHDRSTTYQAYLAVYNELTAAYQELWETAAQRRYRTPYRLLAPAQQKLIRADFPLVISEAEPADLMPEAAGRKF